MKILNLYEQILAETLLPEEYHYTYLSYLLKIMQSDTLNLSSNIGTSADAIGGKFFFLSLSRTGSPKLGYNAGYNGLARIVFDGNKLNNNFKSIPVDYWGEKQRKFEYEDRIITDKPVINNISKYIKRLDIVTDFSEVEVHRIKQLFELAESKNVAINVYGSSNDMVKRTNLMNDKIKSIENNYDDDGYDSKWEGVNFNYLFAILMFSREYIKEGGYENFKSDFEKFALANGVEGVNIEDIYDNIRKLTYSSHQRDVNTALTSDIHNYFKRGASGKFRQYVTLLVRDLRKWGVTSIADLINIKVDGVKPKGPFKDYTDTFLLYQNDYNDNWEVHDNEPLEDTNVHFKGMEYGGLLPINDIYKLYDYKKEYKTVYEYINYLLNKYTFEKVQEIVYTSNYNQYSDVYKFKLVKN